MVQGVVIFAVDGRLPLFSVFFTPEGNDERMQARQQAIIRRVHEDYLLRMQYSRDVILAKPLLLPASLREAGSRSAAPDSSSSSATRSSSATSSSSASGSSATSSSATSSIATRSSASSGSASSGSASSRSNNDRSSSCEKRQQSREKGKEEGQRCGPAAAGGPPATAAARPAATTTPPYAAEGGSSSEAGKFEGAAARAGGATAAETRLFSVEESEEFPWDDVFPAPEVAAFSADLRGSAEGEIPAGVDPTEAPVACSAVHSVAAATATAAAAGEVAEGVLHLTTSSLFPSARLIIWKHVEGVCYCVLCGAMENVALVLNFLSLFAHCLDEAFTVSFPASPLPLKQQLLTRPDIVLLVLHVLLPGGQVLVINSSYAAFLKKKIRASLGVAASSRAGGVAAAGQLSP